VTQGVARRLRAGSAGLALVLLLAGCTVALPDAAVPEKPGFPWTDAEAELWVARDAGCGECDHGTESATRDLTLLYRDGAVLHAQYGEGGQEQLEGYPPADGDRRGLTFAFPAEQEPYRDDITQAWTAMHGEAPNLVRVHTVQAYRIDPTEREDILRVVEHAVDQSSDLGGTFQKECPADAACSDGLGVTFYTFGAPQATQAHQEIGGQADAAWRLLEDQVIALHAWLDEQDAASTASSP
jgi:hypothetical protein